MNISGTAKKVVLWVGIAIGVAIVGNPLLNGAAVLLHKLADILPTWGGK
jgi:hypothetical protein